jgi:hypothetical protein
LPPPLAMRVCSVAHSSVAAELCVRRSVGLDALGFAAAWLMVRVVGILLGRWCRAAGGFIGEFVGPASLPGTGVRDRECAVAAAARRSSTWRARGFGLAASRARGKQWGELLKTGCSAAVQVRSEEIARLRLRRGRRGITASAIRPAAGKMRRGFVLSVVECHCVLATCSEPPSAARAFPAVSNSSAQRDPAGSVPRGRRRRPGPGVYTVDRG